MTGLGGLINMDKTIPSVSVITVNYNGRGLLTECFDSLLALNYPRDKIEIIMVDNCSSDGSVDFVKARYPKVTLVSNDINNYCRANNLGITRSKSEFVAILNNDTRVDKQWLAELIRVISSDDKIGLVGGKILFPDGRIQSAGHVRFPNYNWADRGFLDEDSPQYNQLEEVESVSNCSAVYRRKALDKLGLFDEDFNMYMEDVDLAFRLRSTGLKVLFVPGSITYHKLHGSAQKEDLRQFYILRNRLLFIAKYFPDKLEEAFCGFGDIARLPYADFQGILVAVFNKLLKHQKLDKTLKIMSGLQKSMAALSSYRQHCFREELEKKTAAIQQQAEEKDRQLQSIVPELEARNSEILKIQNALVLAQQQLEAKDSQLQSTFNELKARNDEVSTIQRALDSAQRQLEAKDSQLQSILIELKARNDDISAIQDNLGSAQRQLEARDSQMQSILIELKARNDDISAIQDGLGSAQRQLESKDSQLQSVLTELKARNDEIISGQQALGSARQQLEAKDSRLLSILAELKAREDQILTGQSILGGVQQELQARDSRIEALLAELKARDEQISDGDKAVGEKTDEISRIYNSQTYRFIVRPLIWPSLDLAKSIIRLFFRLSRPIRHILGGFKKEDKGIFIASFTAENAIAKYLKENVYQIKLFNNEYKERKVNLIVNICPYHNSYHPQRHFAYYVIEAAIAPRNYLMVKMIYNWDKNPVFLINGSEVPLNDHWRGQMKSFEPYLICAYTKSLEGEMQGGQINIVQRLEQ
jgi:GT2 family glycosyltransferase